MDYLNINQANRLLVICENEAKAQLEETTKSFPNKTLISPDELPGFSEDEIDAVLVKLQENQITNKLLIQLLKKCKPGAYLAITEVSKNVEDIEFILKTSGFVNVELKIVDTGTIIQSQKPKYQVGSSTKLNLKKPTATVWKLDDDDNEDVETIDPDNLLDEDDLKKPDPSSLRVCGTTGKRKACKDCSCGLAEELATEVKTQDIVDTSNAPKSSCGSCYLGDAFRCASCPYLGMPAFKPGEKIQLGGNLLKADI